MNVFFFSLPKFLVFLESGQLLYIDLRIECFVAFKQIAINYAFPNLPYTQHDIFPCVSYFLFDIARKAYFD